MGELNKKNIGKKQVSKPAVEPDFAKQFIPEALANFSKPGKLPVTAPPDYSGTPEVATPVASSLTSAADAITLSTNRDKLKLKAGLATYESRPTLPSNNNGVKIDLNKVKGKENIMAMQEQLKAAGYDLGNYQGKGGVDGSVGSKTRAAVAAFNAGKASPGITFKYTARKKGGEPCLESQCGQYQNAELLRRSGLNIGSEEFKNTLGLNTDAWKMGDAMVKKGGTTIYNRDDNVMRHGKPQVGDVVGIRLGGSDYQKRADIEGDSNTHTGFISKVYPDGTYDVEHNVHKGTKGDYKGQAYTSHVKNGKLGRFNTLVVRKITRPNYAALKGESKDLTTNPDNQLYYNNPNPRAQEAVSYFNKNKEKFVNQFGLSEGEAMSLGNAALGIIDQESKWGELTGGTVGLKGKEILSEAGKRLWGALTPAVYGKDIEASKGLGRVKHEINFKDQDYHRIFSPTSSGEEAITDVIAILSRKFLELKKAGLSEENALYRSIINHNNPSKADNMGKGSASSFDNDYANKVLVNMKESGIINKGKKYNTGFNTLQLSPKVLENAAKIKSIYTSLKSGGSLIIKNIGGGTAGGTKNYLRAGYKPSTLGSGTPQYSMQDSISSVARNAQAEESAKLIQKYPEMQGILEREEANPNKWSNLNLDAKSDSIQKVLGYSPSIVASPQYLQKKGVYNNMINTMGGAFNTKGSVEPTGAPQLFGIKNALESIIHKQGTTRYKVLDNLKLGIK